MTMDRTPGEGRYARIEREQRWLLASVPHEAVFRAEITDHYFSGTSLRLRKVTTETSTTLKLTQKVRIDEANREFVKVTNIYLTPEEYEMFAKLPALLVAKQRFDYREGRSMFAVDSLAGRHRGLVVAEIEILGEDSHVDGPSCALAEVTGDDRFSGGYLAAMADGELAKFFEEIGGWAHANDH